MMGCGLRLRPVKLLQSRRLGLLRQQDILYQRLHTKSPHRSAAAGQDAFGSIPPQSHQASAEPMLPSFIPSSSTTTAYRPSSRLFSASSSSTSHLSTPLLLKTWLLTLFTSTPLVLGPSIKILSAIAYSPPTSFLSPTRNPILRWALKKTIYNHFCAGENAAEVGRTIERLRSSGVGGLILCYAKEIEVRGEETMPTMVDREVDAMVEEEINAWAEGVVKTLDLVPAEGFVSIKLSGAGTQTLHHLKHNTSPPPLLAEHLHKICNTAVAKKVRICVDAEQSSIQPGIDSWTVDLMRQYNQTWACIYNTYQTYLLSSPASLTHHLTLAAKENWILGVKLVRGAYLASEERSLFWSSKEETDENFDNLAKSLILQSWDGLPQTATITQPNPEFPGVALVLATHNLSSCRQALSLRRTQSTKGEKQIDLTYAQLQGMADHVTGEIINNSNNSSSSSSSSINAPTPEKETTIPTTTIAAEQPKIAKYLTWGTVAECSKYLVRRVEENRDAVTRNIEGRAVLGREIMRRLGLVAWWGR